MGHRDETDCGGPGFCLICDERPFDYHWAVKDLDQVHDHDTGLCGDDCALCDHNRGSRACTNPICCPVAD